MRINIDFSKLDSVLACETFNQLVEKAIVNERLGLLDILFPKLF